MLLYGETSNCVFGSGEGEVGGERRGYLPGTAEVVDLKCHRGEEFPGDETGRGIGGGKTDKASNAQ